MSGSKTDPELPHRRKDDESRTLPLGSPTKEAASAAPAVGDTASFHPQPTSHPTPAESSRLAAHPIPLYLVNDPRYSSVGVLYSAKSRVLRRLRHELEGLLD